MMKTTIGKTLDEVRRMSRNRLTSDLLLSNINFHKKFILNTGKKHISNVKRNAVINAVNEEIMNTVVKGQYNVRFPGLGVMTIIKLRLRRPMYGNSHLKNKLFPKIHFYFQVSGEEARTMVYDLQFYAARKYKKKLKELYPSFIDTIKEVE